MSLLGLGVFIHSEPLYSARVTNERWVPFVLQAQHSQLLESATEELAPEHRVLAFAIATTVLKVSLHYEMDPFLLLAMIKTESRFKPLVRGLHGEIGLMQILPQTAQWMAVRMGMKWNGPESLFDPETNIRVSTAYLNFLRTRFGAKNMDYVSAYNMGAANVRRLKAQDISPEIYANKVLGNYRSIQAQVSLAD